MNREINKDNNLSFTHLSISSRFFLKLSTTSAALFLFGEVVDLPVDGGLAAFFFAPMPIDSYMQIQIQHETK